MLVENCQFEPTLPLFGAPVGVTLVEFRWDFWLQKTRISALSYIWPCLRDPTFSRFGITGVWRTDGQTDRRI